VVLYTTFKINAEVQMDRIRQLRKDRGLSQAKLAVMADMDPATLNRLERGTGNPNLKTLERVADALDVEMGDLLGKAQAPLPFEEAAGGRRTPTPKAPPDLDAADLEDWASEADTLDELRPVRRALWLQWRELADYDRVVRGGERALADALEAEEKRTIIDRRMMELAPAPLATIAMHLDEPTWVIYHRDPTDDERARLIAEYPDAVEVEAERVALAY
jgi:transcriptional regulator with XRE-family HTH domain